MTAQTLEASNKELERKRSLMQQAREQRRQEQRQPSLNPQQQEFVKHYALINNATQAARLAGYHTKSASTTGLRLLKKEHVRAAIEKARKEKWNVVGSEFISKARNLKNKDNYSAYCLEKMEKAPDTSKAKWMELIGKNYGLFSDAGSHVQVFQNMGHEELMHKARAIMKKMHTSDITCYGKKTDSPRLSSSDYEDKSRKDLLLSTSNTSMFLPQKQPSSISVTTKDKETKEPECKEEKAQGKGTGTGV